MIVVIPLSRALTPNAWGVIHDYSGDNTMKKALGGHGARNRRSIVGIGSALALGLTAVCGSVHAAYTCADLAAVTTADSTVTSAATVAAGTNVNGAVLPVAACRVQGMARPSSDSEIKFEVWLPPTARRHGPAG